MSPHPYSKHELPQASPLVNPFKKVLGYAVTVAAIGGVAICNKENIHDLVQPRPPVAQVYNDDSCLIYDGKKYVLSAERALADDGIDKLLLRHNPRPTPTLEDAFRAANGMKTSMLYKGRKYFVPSPDRGNKCGIIA